MIRAAWQSSEECRKLAAEYRALANIEGTTKRVANLLLNVSRTYAGLAATLDLLEQVQNEEAHRLSHQRRSDPPEP